MNIYLKTKDYAVSGEDFKLIFEEELELLKTHPVPDELDPYYEHESYISHTDRSQTMLEKVYQRVKKYNFRKKEAWISAYASSEAAVLDVGAGTGSFVQYLNSRGWKAKGMEPNKGARQAALQKGIELFARMEDVPDQKFDVLTLWHVLEHFKDLQTEIDRLLTKVNENGVLFVAVPNYRSYDAQYYKMYWAGYDVPRHLWHFSPFSIQHIFSKKGWEVVDQKPMLFDAFYVSLLSERYRNKKWAWLRALYVGIRSNLNGQKTGHYSSLVYILKKRA